MIECKIRRDKNCRIKANGTPREICSETLYIVQAIFAEIKKNDENAAERFRRDFIAAMIDPNSPIFK